MIAVDTVGLPADYAELTAITERHGLFLVEDAACAVGATYQGRKAGALAPVACLSFHGRKGATSGEGGALLTADPLLAADARLRSSFGIGSIFDQAQIVGLPIPEFTEIGYNYKLSDIAAAILQVQLGRVDELLARRVAVAARYAELLADEPLLTLPHVPDDRTHAWQTYMVTLDPTVDRAAVATELRGQGIGSGHGTWASHLQPVFDTKQTCPVSADLFERNLAIPMHAELDLDQVERVAEALRAALAPTSAHRRAGEDPHERRPADTRSDHAAHLRILGHRHHRHGREPLAVHASRSRRGDRRPTGHARRDLGPRRAGAPRRTGESPAGGGARRRLPQQCRGVRVPGRGHPDLPERLRHPQTGPPGQPRRPARRGPGRGPAAVATVEVADNPHWENLVQAIAAQSVPVATIAADILRLADAGDVSILDVGGGSGIYSAIWLGLNPSARATQLDWAPINSIAHRLLAERVSPTGSPASTATCTAPTSGPPPTTSPCTPTSPTRRGRRTTSRSSPSSGPPSNPAAPRRQRLRGRRRPQRPTVRTDLRRRDAPQEQAGRNLATGRLPELAHQGRLQRHHVPPHTVTRHVGHRPITPLRSRRVRGAVTAGRSRLPFTGGRLGPRAHPKRGPSGASSPSRRQVAPSAGHVRWPSVAGMERQDADRAIGEVGVIEPGETVESLYAAIERTARVLDVPCSRDRVLPILTVYGGALARAVVAFRWPPVGPLGRPRLPVHRSPGRRPVPVGRRQRPARADGPPDQRPARRGADALLDRQLRHRLRGGRGFKKVWLVLPAGAAGGVEARQDPGDAAQPGREPRLLRPVRPGRHGGSAGDRLPEADRERVLRRTPAGGFAPDSVRSMLREVDQAEPSAQMLELGQRAFGIYVTVNWDSPKVERVCFAVATADPAELRCRSTRRSSGSSRTCGSPRSTRGSSMPSPLSRTASTTSSSRTTAGSPRSWTSCSCPTGLSRTRSSKAHPPDLKGQTWGL
ncbi:aromatic prenyltransferase [Micromonospora sp. M12]